MKSTIDDVVIQTYICINNVLKLHRCSEIPFSTTYLSTNLCYIY